jgi:hypothetical protein
MDKATAIAVIREQSRRMVVLGKLRASCFGKQLEFIDNPSRQKAALCSRRAGKSRAAAVYLYLEAFRRPRTTCLYVALTRSSAKTIMWSLLKNLNRDLGLGLSSDDFNESDLAVRLPNGSVIRLFGADSDQKQREKLLGDAYSLVIIDEAASFRMNLRGLIYEVLKPATADYQGTICLVGTPSDLRNFFYDVTEQTGEEAGSWWVTKWNTIDNPHMSQQWKNDLAEIDANRPLYKKTAEYKFMYLGEWAISTSRLVYAFDDQVNLAPPPDPNAAMGPSYDYYVLAVDLGWNDATAYTVVGWQEGKRTLHVLRSFKKPAQTISDVATEIRALGDTYPFMKMLVDGAAKQAVQELRGRYMIPLHPTDKHDKFSFIRMMNSDLLEGHIKVSKEECQDLLTEWGLLVWAPKGEHELTSLPRELESCKNDAADSCLYAWRFARNYLPQPAHVEKLDPNSEKAMDVIWEQKAKSLSVRDVWGDDDA